MQKESPTLVATKRERTGSRYSRRDRTAGRMPAVVYGHGKGPVSISLDAKDAIGHISKGEKVFELELEGAKEHVLIRDIGYDHLGTNILHADFARVDLDERVNTKAHLKLIGEAAGLKHAHTVLMHPVTELELNCTVSNLPETIEVDITELDIGHAIHARDVKLPFDTMKLLTDPEAIVAQVVVLSKEEEPETDEAGEVAAEGAEPEVIGEKKDDEEGKDAS